MHRSHTHSLPVRLASWLAVGLAALLVTVAVTGSTPDEDALLAAISAQRARVALEHDAEALNDLANLLVLAGDLQEAEDNYRIALELDPERIEVVYNLALLLQHDGRVREALKLFRRVVELSPDAAWAHLQIGVIASDLGKRKPAVKAFQRAFELEPRLASRAVNPHIADRPEAVQALLEAGNDRPARSAPLSFAEPDRVARMLLADAAVTRAATRAAQSRGILPEAEPAATDDAPDPTRAAVEKRKARRLAVESLPGERPRDAAPRDDSSTAEPSFDDAYSDDPADAEAEMQRFRDDEPDATDDRVRTDEQPVRRVVGAQDLREVSGGGATSSAAESPGNSRAPGRATAPSQNRGRSTTSAPNRGGASRFRPGRRSSARLELRLGDEPVQVATSRWAPLPSAASSDAP